jgi:hypothetical protein
MRQNDRFGEANLGSAADENNWASFRRENYIGSTTAEIGGGKVIDVRRKVARRCLARNNPRR